ncbi:MAG: uroporphyrinogen-III synthase [Rhodobacter sp.]|nr:uroporphyrinogen-III synthase [Rhodobacter sp.]
MVISPVLRIEPRDALVDLTGVAGVVLTSENGVLGLPRTVPEGLVAYCVGDRTADAARASGLSAVSAGGAIEDLAALIRNDALTGPLLHLRGAEVRGDLPAILAGTGAELREVVVYDQVPLDLTAEAKGVLSGTAPLVAPLFSPRSAALLGTAAQGAAAPLWLVALSPAVAEAWRGPEPALLRIADRPDAAAMTERLVTIYTGNAA